MPRNFTPGYLPKKNKNISTKKPQKTLYKNVHGSFIHNNPKLKMAQVSINRRMAK